MFHWMSPARNICAVMHGKSDIRIEERALPVPSPNQVLIQVHTVGICGTDVHFWCCGAVGPFVVKEPLVLGHEACGTVIDVGSQVKHLKVGDRVAVEPGVPCKECSSCKSGKYNLCPGIRFHAAPPIDGCLARYIVHEADFCFRIADNMTMEDGSLVEPLSVAVHSCRRANVSFGQKVVILGAGPIGVMNLLAAKAMGASLVAMTDISEERLKLAKTLGADVVLNVKGMEPPQASSELLQKLGSSPDTALECTGFSSSVATAIHVVKTGGVVMLIGLGSNQVEIPLPEVVFKELDLRAVFRYVVDCFPTAIEMISSGKVDTQLLSRARYTLEQSQEAFERSKKGDVIKVFIRCDDST